MIPSFQTDLGKHVNRDRQLEQSDQELHCLSMSVYLDAFKDWNQYFKVSSSDEKH